jgi:hypothetical protein
MKNRKSFAQVESYVLTTWKHKSFRLNILLNQHLAGGAYHSLAPRIMV